ncbi:myosin light chain kinase family member 4 [Caretta caretta]|uniref:myosin light chain kinase family member 4 n=1 Tax=Caretta caretta TaxID=8467 RepID=UPI003D5BB0F8
MTTSSRTIAATSRVNSLVKIFDPSALQNQGLANEVETTQIPLAASKHVSSSESCNTLDVKFASLGQKIDKLLTVQDNVLQTLNSVSQEMCCIEKDIEMLKAKATEPGPTTETSEKLNNSEMKGLCIEMTNTLSDMNKSAEQQAKRLDGMEQIVLGLQELIGFVTEKFKTCKITDLILRNKAPPKLVKVGGYIKKYKVGNNFRMQTFSDKRDMGTSSNRNEKAIGDQKEKEKSCLSAKGTKSIKKKKPPDTTEGANQENQSCPHKETVHMLNKENTEKASAFLVQKSSPKSQGPKDKEKDLALKSQKEHTKSSVQTSFSTGKSQGAEVAVDDDSQRITGQDEEKESESLEGVKRAGGQQVPEEERQEEEEEEDDAGHCGEEEEESATASQNEHEAEDDEGPTESRGQDARLQRCKGSEKGTGSKPSGTFSQNPEQTCQLEHRVSSKCRVHDEGLIKADNKKSRVDAESAGDKCKRKEAIKPNTPQDKPKAADSTGTESDNQAKASIEDVVTVIDDGPAPPAPFDHRIVSAKKAVVNSFYEVNRNEVLGGGRFGQVHKCEEKATGLKLAAKIIKARGAKEKEEVKNEINVMNQLNHVNLIQLYDAFESKNDIVLVMEYVDGGELFDRIIDDNYSLTEMDTILFTKQICQGIQYMHQMYILHLDLKPENILCVNRAAYQIKIIDFGLARRYKPREKLKVNFGTPEFLAPEVVNYDFVSFPTDMWSVGVIAYMLLSGLSPFLGDDDNETLNNILACSWDFENEEFQDVSEEAKDFLSKLLIKEKSWRMSATSSLKHPWLSDHKLHCGLHKQRKAKCHSESEAPMAQ